MADMNRRGADGDCEGEGERGERGKRGHRGHDGATGPTGPTGSQAATFGALLKFSGRAAGIDSESGTPGISFLPDSGFGFSVSPIFVPENYPIARAHDVRDMAANLVGFVVPQGGLVVIDLLRNGVVVPGFTITYNPGEGGVKTILAGPSLFAAGDVLDVRVTTSGTVTSTIDTSVTIGVE